MLIRPLSVYQKLFFLISKPKHMLLVLKRTVSMRPFFWHTKHVLKLIGRKLFTIFTLKNFVYLNLWLMHEKCMIPIFTDK